MRFAALMFHPGCDAVNANVAPPVCQIMDYGAEQYRKKKKEKARAKISRKRQTKGVQMKVTT